MNRSDDMSRITDAISNDYISWDQAQESGIDVVLASTKRKNEDWVTFVPSEGINFDFSDYTDSKFDKENKELTLNSENGTIDKLQWVSAKEIPEKIIDSYFGTESRDYSKISGFIDFLLDDLDLDKDKGCFDVCLLTLLEEMALKLRNRSIRDDS